MLKLLSLILGSLFFLTSCYLSDDNIYTLYRSEPNSAVELERVHIATFDSEDGEEYNRANCRIASELFQNQPLVDVKYWCEKGRYRK